MKKVNLSKEIHLLFEYLVNYQSGIFYSFRKRKDTDRMRNFIFEVEY